MKNKASSHFLVLTIIVILAAIGHYAIYYGALIRGYETSLPSAFRNLALLSLLAILPIFSRLIKFKGNWTLYTTAVLLFSIGLTVQYRLFSDLEYASRDKKDTSATGKDQNSTASFYSRKLFGGKETDDGFACHASIAGRFIERNSAPIK
ncbi:MAG: hypothetical protein HC846_06205 [Blastocatellia bacterium]|nr:hypothetical protein [Blastocatellia bacterium]